MILFKKRIFPNGEKQFILQAKVKNLSCAIISRSLQSDLLDLILLSDLLKKEGAKRVVAIIPYLEFSRQDKNEIGKSWGMKTIAKILKTSEIDKIIVLDLHSEEGRRLFGEKINSISAIPLFAKQIRKMDLKDFCVIAPDEGAIKRAKRLAAALNSKFGYLRKIRGKAIKHHSFSGERAKTAFIYDDILDTGGTLVGAVKELKKQGFEDIYIFVTHGQFTGEKWRKLFKLGVKEIYTTDTIPGKIKNKRIKTLQTAPLIKRAMKGAA